MRQVKLLSMWLGVALAVTLAIGGLTHVTGARWEIIVNPGSARVEFAARTEHARIALKL